MKHTILAVDPGVTTGYCLAIIEDGELHVTPYKKKHDVSQHYEELRSHTPQHIVCEEFHYRKGQRDNLILYSKELIGVMHLYAMRNGAKVHMQLPSEGKSYYSDTQLKEFGVYKRSAAPHGSDATRHLMHWLTFKAGFQLIDIHVAKIVLH